MASAKGYGNRFSALGLESLDEDDEDDPIHDHIPDGEDDGFAMQDLDKDSDENASDGEDMEDNGDILDSASSMTGDPSFNKELHELINQRDRAAKDKQYLVDAMNTAAEDLSVPGWTEVLGVAGSMASANGVMIKAGAFRPVLQEKINDLKQTLVGLDDKENIVAELMSFIDSFSDDLIDLDRLEESSKLISSGIFPAEFYLSRASDDKLAKNSEFLKGSLVIARDSRENVTNMARKVGVPIVFPTWSLLSESARLKFMIALGCFPLDLDSQMMSLAANSRGSTAPVINCTILRAYASVAHAIRTTKEPDRYDLFKKLEGIISGPNADLVGQIREVDTLLKGIYGPNATFFEANQSVMELTMCFLKQITQGNMQEEVHTSFARGLKSLVEEAVKSALSDGSFNSRQLDSTFQNLIKLVILRLLSDNKMTNRRSDVDASDLAGDFFETIKGTGPPEMSGGYSGISGVPILTGAKLRIMVEAFVERGQISFTESPGSDVERSAKELAQGLEWVRRGYIGNINNLTKKQILHIANLGAEAVNVTSAVKEVEELTSRRAVDHMTKLIMTCFGTDSKLSDHLVSAFGRMPTEMTGHGSPHHLTFVREFEDVIALISFTKQQNIRITTEYGIPNSILITEQEPELFISQIIVRVVCAEDAMKSLMHVCLANANRYDMISFITSQRRLLSELTHISRGRIQTGESMGTTGLVPAISVDGNAVIPIPSILFSDIMENAMLNLDTAKKNTKKSVGKALSMMSRLTEEANAKIRASIATKKIDKALFNYVLGGDDDVTDLATLSAALVRHDAQYGTEFQRIAHLLLGFIVSLLADDKSTVLGEIVEKSRQAVASMPQKMSKSDAEFAALSSFFSPSGHRDSSTTTFQDTNIEWVLSQADGVTYATPVVSARGPVHACSIYAEGSKVANNLIPFPKNPETWPLFLSSIPLALTPSNCVVIGSVLINADMKAFGKAVETMMLEGNSVLKPLVYSPSIRTVTIERGMDPYTVGMLRQMTDIPPLEAYQLPCRIGVEKTGDDYSDLGIEHAPGYILPAPNPAQTILYAQGCQVSCTAKPVTEIRGGVVGIGTDHKFVKRFLCLLMLSHSPTGVYMLAQALHVSYSTAAVITVLSLLMRPGGYQDAAKTAMQFGIGSVCPQSVSNRVNNGIAAAMTNFTFLMSPGTKSTVNGNQCPAITLKFTACGINVTLLTCCMAEVFGFFCSTQIHGSRVVCMGTIDPLSLDSNTMKLMAEGNYKPRRRGEHASEEEERSGFKSAMELLSLASDSLFQTAIQPDEKPKLTSIIRSAKNLRGFVEMFRKVFPGRANEELNIFRTHYPAV